MGFSSFLTNDTQRSISNSWSSRGALPVVLVDNKGNHWEEVAYEGYCSFGGVDYFVVLSLMNGLMHAMDLDNETLVEEGRCKGIDMYYKQAEGTLYPNLVEAENFFTGWEWVNKRPESCINQGYFY